MDEREKFELVMVKIKEFNDDESVTGLIVYFPIFGDDRVSRFGSKVGEKKKIAYGEGWFLG
jgi:5,10-methylene-tetrahydrofolate dehydrogenase/methenyl tetrahydrofolate cyclohydrolase